MLLFLSQFLEKMYTNFNLYIFFLFCILIYFQGDSGAKPLESSADNFERGKVDSFSIECPNLGIVDLVVELIL